MKSVSANDSLLKQHLIRHSESVLASVHMPLQVFCATYASATPASATPAHGLRCAVRSASITRKYGMSYVYNNPALILGMPDCCMRS